MLTDRSARSATVADAVALLLAGLGSSVAEETAAVLEMRVPAAAAESTRTVRENSALPPMSSAAAVQKMGPAAPTAGVEHVQPAGELRDWNVVPAGTVSERETVAAGSGPELVAVIV
jgi:hypothetical protein